jgi:signal transduction histidine kinase
MLGKLEETERKLRLEAVFRERFMAVLAHDLRQPLSTVIMGFHPLSLLQLPDRVVSVTDRQLRAAKRMQRMIADLLDSTRHRPESGMPIERQSTDFAEVAQKTLDEIRAVHPGRSIERTLRGPCVGHWDPDRLAQVLSDLVGNALTHGEPQCKTPGWLWRDPTVARCFASFRRVGQRRRCSGFGPPEERAGLEHAR